MGTASAKQLSASMAKAKSVGMVEEGFTIGDCQVTLRNLRPDEYEAIVAETSELEDLSYLNGFQTSHVCRSIVEVNGVDLRDIDFVEVEEPDPKDKTKTKLVKRELHDWIRRYVISTWSKEAIYTTYRKFSDVVYLAENKAKDGVKFVVAEESPEEKFRRLLGDLKEIENEVPPPLVKAILEEYGYSLYTRVQDEEALKDFAAETSDGGEGAVSEGPQAPEASPAPTSPAAPPVAAQPVTDPAMRAAQIMRERVPVSRRTEVPPPVVPAAPPPAPPNSVPQPVYVTPPPGAPKRSAEIAAALAEDDLGVTDEQIAEMRAAPPQAVIPPGMVGSVPLEGPKPVLAKQGAHHTDPQAMATILNPRAPVGVMNPKFRGPPRGNNVR